MSSEQECPDCEGHGYVVTAPAVYPPHDNAHPEEAEPCWCMAAVRQGWTSMEDHRRIVQAQENA